MLPVLAVHLKPRPASFSARLQTTFALLIPGLRWTYPSWQVIPSSPSLSLWAANLGGVATRLLLILFKVVLVCLSHLILHSDCPVKSASQSDKHTPLLNQHRDSLALTSPRSLCFVFSAVTKLCEPPKRYDGVKDMTGWREALGSYLSNC